MKDLHLLPRSVVREAIFQSQGGMCFWCKKKMRLRNKSEKRLAANVATLEHLIPGNNSPGNIVVACHACNNRRGDSMIDPFSGDKFTIVEGRVVKIPKKPEKIITKPKKPNVPWVLLGLFKKNPNKKNLALLIGAKRK